MNQDPNRTDDRIHPLARRVLFIDSPAFGRGFLVVLAIAAVVLAVVDLFHHRHTLFSWDGFPGFHALFGFCAFSFVVIMGWPLRQLLSRPETYYGEGDEDD